VPRVNVSVKCSALCPHLDPLAFAFHVTRLKERLRPILRVAVVHGAFVNLDMEQNDYRALILAAAEELFCEPEFTGYPHLGMVCQSYLRDALQDLQSIGAWAGRRGAPLTIRLVKGAYWDYEVAKAALLGWPVPVFTRKADTDRNFERCLDFLAGASPRLITAIGSHNVRSLAYGMALAEERGLKRDAIEIQMLYGMANPFKQAVGVMGYRLREYAPVGRMLPGMAYLVRRLLENTSNQGFLSAASAAEPDVEALLAAPG
jgi:RHH-type proline utilization regulon transcriptional repressor/proline dehydrogenase/delta 1-pyrroline-5-carboxylate dehydrogenase